MNWRGIFYPHFERDEDDGHILWYSVEWQRWVEGWLPAHFYMLLNAKRLRETIRRKGQWGDWWVLPDGYRYDIIHKKPVYGMADPLGLIETVGIKFTHASRLTASDIGGPHGGRQSSLPEN